MPNWELNRAKSKKWSPTEVQQLLDAINAANCAPEDINWAAVAENGPVGRTGKQCREKYKNDLRPDLSKAPWTGQEEYILARAHCEIGNQWAEIARFLPGRSENTIKNKWNATLRAKADTKAHTLLWTYAQTWQAQNKNTSLEVFEMAVREFCQQNGQASLEEVKVPESFFQNAGLCGRGVGSSGGLASSASEVASLGGSQPHRGGRSANARQTSRRAQPRHGNRKRSRSAYDSEEEDDQEDWSDSEDEGGRAAAKCPHTKRTGTAMIQQQLRRQRQQQQEELERLELSQLPPPAYMPQNFALPSTLPFQAPPQPPPPPPSNTLVPPFPQQQQQQQQHQQPAAFPPRAPALADITNLAHLSPLEPSATIKLCVPKHAQDSLKGFSFISNAAPHSATCQPSQAGGMGIQGGGEYSQQQQGQDVQGSMGTLLQQQGAALHARTPGCKLGHAAAQLGSPNLGTGRPGCNNGPSPWLSPSLPHDVEYSSMLTDLGLEDFGNSPAAFRICNARPSDTFEQIPPLSVVKGRPSWMPEFDVSYHNTLAMLQSPVSFMAQPPTQPVAAPGTCLPTPRYTHVPPPVASLLGSPIPGPSPSSNATAAACAGMGASGTSVGAPAPGDTSAAGGGAAALAAGVPALSGGFAPTPIRCPSAKTQGVHHSAMRPELAGYAAASLLSPVPPIRPLDRVNAHPSPRPQPLDRRLTLHAAACGQQTPHREQQQEPLLLGQSLAGAPLPPFFQAPLSAIKGQGTPRNAGLAQVSEAQPSLLNSAPGHPSLASLLRSPLPTGPSLHRLHYSSSPFPKPFGLLMHGLQQQEQQQQQVQQLEQADPAQEQQQFQQPQGRAPEQRDPRQHGFEVGPWAAFTHKLDAACLQQSCSPAANLHAHELNAARQQQDCSPAAKLHTHQLDVAGVAGQRQAPHGSAPQEQEQQRAHGRAPQEQGQQQAQRLGQHQPDSSSMALEALSQGPGHRA